MRSSLISGKSPQVHPKVNPGIIQNKSEFIGYSRYSSVKVGPIYEDFCTLPGYTQRLPTSGVWAIQIKPWNTSENYQDF